MILEEATLIEAHPERVFDFFRHMDGQRYLDWHPDHLLFRWVEGNALQEGSLGYFLVQKEVPQSDKGTKGMRGCHGSSTRTRR